MARKAYTYRAARRNTAARIGLMARLDPFVYKLTNFYNEVVGRRALTVEEFEKGLVWTRHLPFLQALDNLKKPLTYIQKSNLRNAWLKRYAAEG